jgi:hypothetical protein
MSNCATGSASQAEAEAVWLVSDASVLLSIDSDTTVLPLRRFVFGEEKNDFVPQRRNSNLKTRDFPAKTIWTADQSECGNSKAQQSKEHDPTFNKTTQQRSEHRVRSPKY